MSISKSDLQKTYRDLPTNELLDMYQNREGYTNLAVEVMIEELRSRELSDADKENYLHHIVLQKDEMFQRENFRSLMFIEKLVFYYLFFVIMLFAFFFTLLASETKRNGYKLKIRQALLYVAVSFCNIFIAEAISKTYTLHLWAAGFLVPYLIDYRASVIRKRVYKKIYSSQE